MTVHVVMPVFNRIEMTKEMLDCLRQQQSDESFRLIVIDDGSTDGTAEYLAGQCDLTVLTGNGNLWWGGAVDVAMRHIFAIANPTDWVLLVNNDTKINPNFLQCMLDVAYRNPNSAVGSVIKNKRGEHLLSIGPKIDANWLTIHDRLSADDSSMEAEIWEVDALSGRGVLLPVAGLISIGGMRPRWLPHYLADYDVSLRLKAQGWRLLVTDKAAVYSEEEYGSQYRSASLREKLWSVRSPSYIPALIVFWWEASSWIQRLTLFFRMSLFMAFPNLRKK